MDDVCQLFRTFRKYKDQHPRNTEWGHNSGDATDHAEVHFIRGLIDILEGEFGNLGWSFKTSVLGPGADAFGMAPFSSAHHFVYGILDLFQQHIQETYNGKVAEDVMGAALQIVQKSPSPSFLRTKAFEVLASLRETGVANDKTFEAIESWPPSRDRDKERAIEEWRIGKHRVEDLERNRRKLKLLIRQSPIAARIVQGEVTSIRLLS